jgi:hypothetical protein
MPTSDEILEMTEGQRRKYLKERYSSIIIPDIEGLSIDEQVDRQ